MNRIAHPPIPTRCEACGDELADEPASGPLHLRCVEWLLATARRRAVGNPTSSNGRTGR